MQVKGEFEVKRTPQGELEVGDGQAIGHMRFDKHFHGPLAATSVVQMLALMTDTPGSGAYVALERIAGTLDGRTGTTIGQVGNRGSTAKPTPSASASAKPTATPSASSTASPTATATPSAAPSATPTSTTTPTPSTSASETSASPADVPQGASLG